MSPSQGSSYARSNRLAAASFCSLHDYASGAVWVALYTLASLGTVCRETERMLRDYFATIFGGSPWWLCGAAAASSSCPNQLRLMKLGRVWAGAAQTIPVHEDPIEAESDRDVYVLERQLRAAIRLLDKVLAGRAAA